MNCVTFNVDYRNGPEVKCLTGQQDFADAICHITVNAASLDIDGSKVCLMGVAAGYWIVTGAANLLAKKNELGRVKAMFLKSGMYSNECSQVTREELTDYERDWGDNDLQTAAA